MKKIHYLFLLTASVFFNAQQYKDYDWGKAETYTPSSAESDLGQITIFDKVWTEFIVDKEEAYDYYIHHTKIFVNSDEAIEKNNKVYIPLRSSSEQVVKQKVRVIKPNGSVVEIKDSDIMESVDERTRTKLTYFALKGLEKKSVIEQILVAKLVPKVSGRTIVLQDNNLTKNVSYEIIYPSHLVFAFKSYNDLPNFVKDDKKYTDKIVEKLDIAEIPALQDEEYSNFVANAKKFSYKLTANLHTGKKDLYGYKQYTEDIFEKLDAKRDSKVDKNLDKFISGIPIAKTEKEKISTIESYVKKNIQFDENADSNLGDALTNKFTNSMGLLNLYYSIFNKLNIKNQVVVVSDRYRNPMDPKFENYQNLDDFAFYFPDSKGYLSPSELESRYPLIPYKWGNSYALFMKKVEFGGATIPDYDIQKIQLAGTDVTLDKMDINVDFTSSLQNPHITTKIEFNGYSAASLQPYYDFIPKENISDFEKELAQNYCGQQEGVTIKTENRGIENISKPFYFTAEFDATNLVQKVGNKILFKVGETIGKQTELYQKDQRKMPIEIQFPHAYTRTLTIKIPDGYSIKNGDQIDSKYTVVNNGKESCKFSTTHTINNNTLTIKNTETYEDNNLPINLYDNYVKVINAAADFNKLVLVLEKK